MVVGIVDAFGKIAHAIVLPNKSAGDVCCRFLASCLSALRFWAEVSMARRRPIGEQTPHATPRHTALYKLAGGRFSIPRIANITLNDAMILPYDANLCRMEFSEGTAGAARTLLVTNLASAINVCISSP